MLNKENIMKVERLVEQTIKEEKENHFNFSQTDLNLTDEEQILFEDLLDISMPNVVISHTHIYINPITGMESEEFGDTHEEILKQVHKIEEIKNRGQAPYFVCFTKRVVGDIPKEMVNKIN